MIYRPRQAFAPLIAAMRKRLSYWTGSESPPLALPRPRPGDNPLPSPEECLNIPICEESPEELARRDAQGRGQFLARQERWEDLADEIRTADQERRATPGGMPIADLLAFGARSDVVQAAEHALLDGRPAKDAPLLEGISALETVLHDHPDDYAVALVVALAHIDLGWAWRGSGWEATVPRLNRGAFVAHLDRASAVLDAYCGIELDSPALAAARCSLLAGLREPHLRIADDYEDLIDLDPQNHRHMRSMGNHLLPRWFGDYDALELEARRTAARTQDIWGNGGYTWVCFDAIAIDEGACARVDVEYFVDGLRDIVSKCPDQAMVNLLAAYCAVALRQGAGLNEEADLTRMQIVDCSKWLIRDHLKEVHPLVWAHAAEGFDNSARITSVSRFAARGRADALHAIAEQFSDDIAKGLSVTFTADGPQLHPA